MKAAVLRRGDFLAAGDCERARNGWLAQPSNALSSLAYVAVGGALVRRALRRGEGRAIAVVYAGAVAANGPGGIAFHGPGGRTGLWLHDAALISTLATMATVDVEELAGRRRTPVPVLAVTTLAGAVLAVVPRLSGSIQTVGMSLVVASEAVRAATASRQGASTLHRLAPVLALGAAAVVHTASRTGGRWCDPDAVIQGHAVWHVLSAGVLWWWGVDRT